MNTYTDGNELKIEVRHLENSQICDLMNSTHGSKKKGSEKSEDQLKFLN